MDLCQAVAQASGVNGNNGIGYGGVDSKGNKDPDANRRNDSNVEWGNLWQRVGSHNTNKELKGFLDVICYTVDTTRWKTSL